MILLVQLLPSLSLAATLRLAADSWYPYNGDPRSDHPGYMIELAREITREAGHGVDYRLLPWSRSLLEARKGNVDCVVGAFRGDAPDFLYPDQSMGREDTAFFSLAANRHLNISSVEELEGVRIAVINGYSYGDQIDEFVKRNRTSSQLMITSGNTPLARNVRLLLAGRVELLIASPNALKATLKQMSLEDAVVEVGRMNNPEELYIACAPGSDRAEYFVRLLSDGVKRLRASGRLQQILDRYGLQDWQ
ncbi:substrate-binding periplasmic protein [Aestuariirhabdus litorea]|uniref:substrate-binding periplasmic protein n=1 Tax=Aestuariirhabdus litorea TaxID=2528527 RepID=UPI0013E2B721|nr:transporter substrate-binding domain-containing protein [Aestuariirhabdus litorea]